MPDDGVAMVMERLAEQDCQSGFVLDGFPHREPGRGPRPAAGRGSAPLDAALSFDVTEEELLRRLAGRAAAQHRADDAEQTTGPARGFAPRPAP